MWVVFCSKCLERSSNQLNHELAHLLFEVLCNFHIDLVGWLFIYILLAEQ